MQIKNGSPFLKNLEANLEKMFFVRIVKMLSLLRVLRLKAINLELSYMANASNADMKWQGLLKLSSVGYGFLPQVAVQLLIANKSTMICIKRKMESLLVNQQKNGAVNSIPLLIEACFRMESETSP